MGELLNRRVESARVAGVLAVVVIHTEPFHLPGTSLGAEMGLATWLNHLARFAVPYFFLVSGYFWVRRMEQNQFDGKVFSDGVNRILRLFGFWSVFYLFPWNFFDTFQYGWLGPLKQVWWNLRDHLQSPIDFLMEGGKEHLWFLSSLMQSMLLSYLFLRLGLWWALAVTVVFLYSIALLAGLYSGAPWGVRVDFNFRNGPFFAGLFFFLGCFCGRFNLLKELKGYGWWILAFGLIMQSLEMWALAKMYSTSYVQDYSVATVLVALGCASVTLGNGQIVSKDWPFWQRGRDVLGVYLIHMALIDLTRSFRLSNFAGSPWDLPYVLGVLIVAFVMVEKMKTIPQWRKWLG